MRWKAKVVVEVEFDTDGREIGGCDPETEEGRHNWSYNTLDLMVDHVGYEICGLHRFKMTACAITDVGIDGPISPAELEDV